MSDLEEFAKTIKRLRRETNSRRQQLILARALKEHKGMVRFFYAAFSERPYCITSAHALKQKKEVEKNLGAVAVRSPIELLGRFAQKEGVFLWDMRAWAACVLRQPREVRGVLCAVLDRDLKIPRIRELFTAAMMDNL